MRTFAKKPKANQKATSAISTKPSRSFVGQSRDVHSILHLHRTIGNQAVLRLLQTSAVNTDAGSASSSSIGFSHDFSRTLVYPGTRSSIKPKLKVNAPRDPYEQEADRIADEMLRQKIPEEAKEKVDIEARLKLSGIGSEYEPVLRNKDSSVQHHRVSYFIQKEQAEGDEEVMVPPRPPVQVRNAASTALSATADRLLVASA